MRFTEFLVRRWDDVRRFWVIQFCAPLRMPEGIIESYSRLTQVCQCLVTGKVGQTAHEPNTTSQVTMQVNGFPIVVLARTANKRASDDFKLHVWTSSLHLHLQQCASDAFRFHR